MQDKSRVCGLKRNLSVGDRGVPWIVDHAMHGGENIGLCGASGCNPNSRGQRQDSCQEDIQGWERRN